VHELYAHTVESMNMPDRKRGKGGEFTSKVSGRQIVTVFNEECSQFPCSLSSSEVHDGLETYFDVDLHRQTVRRRLSDLEESGLLESERDGSKVIYWRLLEPPE